MNTRSQDGAAMVEFALILPILILLVFGIVQFSIVYNRQQGLHAAAREGARLAALPQSTKTQIETRVRDALAGSVDPAQATITISPNTTRPCNLVTAGTRVIVTVQAPYDLTIPLWSGSKVGTLTGKGEFRCE